MHDIEGIFPMYQALLAGEQQATDREHDAVSGQHPPTADSEQSLSTEAAPRDVCLGGAVASSEQTIACAETSDAKQSLNMLSEAEQLAALRDYLTAATAKDCSVMTALRASSPVHLTPTSDVRFFGGPIIDDGASPAMGRFSTPEESSIAFKVRSCHRSALARSTRRDSTQPSLMFLHVTAGLGC